MDGPCGQGTGSLNWKPTCSNIQRKGMWHQEKDGYVRKDEWSRGWNEKVPVKKINNKNKI